MTYEEYKLQRAEAEVKLFEANTKYLAMLIALRATVDNTSGNVDLSQAKSDIYAIDCIVNSMKQYITTCEQAYIARRDLDKQWAQENEDNGGENE